jgi:hypothetical protein
LTRAKGAALAEEREEDGSLTHMVSGFVNTLGKKGGKNVESAGERSYIRAAREGSQRKGFTQASLTRIIRLSAW